MPLSEITITWDDEDRPVISARYATFDESASMEADPGKWLGDLAWRVPDASADHLRALVALNEERGFVSLAELADSLDVDKKVIDGWNRNLGRSVKAVVRDLGFLRTDQEDGTQQLFDFKWDEAKNQWLYAVPGKFRPMLIQGLDERTSA